MKILKVVGNKYSYLILRELNKNSDGLRFKDIDYEIIKSSHTTDRILKALVKENIVRKDGRYYITKKGRDVLPHLESILEISKKKYPKSKEIETITKISKN